MPPPVLQPNSSHPTAHAPFEEQLVPFEDPAVDTFADGDTRSVLLVMGAIVVVALLAAGALTFFSGSGSDAPARLAVLDGQPDQPGITPATLDDSYRDGPQPLSWAAQPTDTDNVFAVFQKMGALSYEKSSPGVFDATYYEAEPDAPTEAAYALCLRAVGNGRDLECSGYDNGTTHTVYGFDWQATLYHLASGEEVLSEAVRSKRATCPAIAFEASSEQQPHVGDLLQRTSSFGNPDEYTGLHLLNDLDNGSARWCETPTALPQVGPATTGPAAFLMIGRSASLESVYGRFEAGTDDPAQVTHIACISFDKAGDAQHTCDFGDGYQLKFNKGAHLVVLVDAATGEILASEFFQASTSCPNFYDFHEGNIVVRNGALADAALVWMTDTMAASRPDDTTSEDRSTEVGDSDDG
ncbi:MAG: hypothetical protein ACI8TP_003763 [Acidimicrobiales bacterium]|jgi:hypothetical protein